MLFQYVRLVVSTVVPGACLMPWSKEAFFHGMPLICLPGHWRWGCCVQHELKHEFIEPGVYVTDHWGVALHYATPTRAKETGPPTSSASWCSSEATWENVGRPDLIREQTRQLEVIRYRLERAESIFRAADAGDSCNGGICNAILFFNNNIVSARRGNIFEEKKRMVTSPHKKMGG